MFYSRTCPYLLDCCSLSAFLSFFFFRSGSEPLSVSVSVSVFMFDCCLRPEYVCSGFEGLRLGMLLVCLGEREGEVRILTYLIFPEWQEKGGRRKTAGVADERGARRGLRGNHFARVCLVNVRNLAEWSVGLGLGLRLRMGASVLHQVTSYATTAGRAGREGGRGVKWSDSLSGGVRWGIEGLGKVRYGMVGRIWVERGRARKGRAKWTAPVPCTSVPDAWIVHHPHGKAKADGYQGGKGGISQTQLEVWVLVLVHLKPLTQIQMQIQMQKTNPLVKPPFYTCALPVALDS